MNVKGVSSEWPDDIGSQDDNRIDWERKQKSKRQPDPSVVTQEEVAVDDALRSPRKNSKKHARKKRRQLVYDENRDEVVVKRKRRRQTDRLPANWEVWLEDEEY